MQNDFHDSLLTLKLPFLSGRNSLVSHPMHLHGHLFRVVASVNLEGNVTVERVKDLDRRGKIERRLDRAPIKDTMRPPGGGFTIVRFHANNPGKLSLNKLRGNIMHYVTFTILVKGYWFFHCHFDQHSNVGMGLVFKVGEHWQFPPKPKNFPKCGNYIPDAVTILRDIKTTETIKI